jgi:acyl-CoA reductase-like NAD-dependent aldehyde dehydrogenase
MEETMAKTINHWINGKEVAGKGTRKSAVFNPATGEQTGELHPFEKIPYSQQVPRNS